MSTTELKWDMIKTIGDEDVVEDGSSDSDVEVEVILIKIIELRLVLKSIIVCLFSTNQKNIRQKVIHISTMNLSFCQWLQSIIMTHGMIYKSI